MRGIIRRIGISALTAFALVASSGAAKGGSDGGTPPANSPSQQQRAARGIKTLQGWYNSSTGLYTNAGWWNSGNAITVLVDFARISTSPATSDICQSPNRSLRIWRTAGMIPAAAASGGVNTGDTKTLLPMSYSFLSLRTWRTATHRAARNTWIGRIGNGSGSQARE